MAEFRKILNIFLPLFLIILNPTFLYADITDTISVTNLVETVLKTDQEDTPEVPKVLSDIVNEYYAEVVIPDSVPALLIDILEQVSKSSVQSHNFILMRSFEVVQLILVPVAVSG